MPSAVERGARQATSFTFTFTFSECVDKTRRGTVVRHGGACWRCALSTVSAESSRISTSGAVCTESGHAWNLHSHSTAAGALWESGLYREQ